MAKREDQQQPLDLDRSTKPQGPVECLGMTFESEDTRRAYLLERLKEEFPELRKRHDFPLGPNGEPATLAEIKKRFEVYLDEKTKGKDPSKIRTVVE